MASDLPVSRSRSIDAVGIISAILAAGLVALSIVRWQSMFAGSRIVVLLALACGLGFVGGLAARLLRQSVVVGLVSVVVGLGLVVTLAFPSSWGDVAPAVVTGWKLLATEGLLASASATLVVPPMIVIGVGAYIATWFAYDVERRARALVVGLATLSVAMMYTIDVARPGPLFGLAFAAVAGLILAADGAVLPAGVAFAGSEAPTSHRRRAFTRAGLAVIGLTVVAAGLAAVIGDIGVRKEPLALRNELQRPITTIEASTPLSAVKSGLVADLPTIMFDITIEGIGPDQRISRIPVAILDDYDGAVFSSGGAFMPAGAVLPNESAGPVVTQRIVLSDDYPFHSLPRAGVVQRLNTNDFLWNESTGTIASLDPAATFEATVVATDVVLSAESTIGSVPGDLWLATGLPDEAELQLAVLDRYIATVVTAPRGSVEGLLQLEAAFRSTEFGYNENAPGGHSLAAVAGYLEGAPGTRASRVGFAEQSAAAYVLLARRIGVPARIVVGYELTEPLTAVAPSQTVTEAMIHAWPEVWTEQGWVRVEPTNKDNAVSDVDPRQPITAAQAGTSSVAPLDEIAPPLLAPDLVEPEVASLNLWRWLWIPLVLLSVGLIALVKRLRTSRRKGRTDPNDRALGAWIELRDRLDDLGHRTEKHESSADLAGHLVVIDLRDEATMADSMSGVLEEALYSPAGTDHDRADQAWQQAGGILDGVRASTGRARRLRAAIDPRTLTRR